MSAKILIDFIFNIDKHLIDIVNAFGPLTYIILFLIIFLETGLVIFPFLPGDSLILVAGIFAGQGIFNVILLFFIFTTAAIVGDAVNYWIGYYFGERAFEKSRFFKKEYLEKTKDFYKEHGGKTIIMARFIPLIRTFAPFVAGIGKMKYSRFFSFNVIGAVAWVSIFLFGGYFFGTTSFVKNNLSWIIILIILASFIPVIIEYVKNRKKI